MTVSDNAKTRWFIYRIAFAILFCLGIFQPQSVVAQKTESFAARCLLPGWSLHTPTRAKRYGITRLRWGPGNEALLPGDQYTISYRVRSEALTLDYCSDVLITTWTIHAVLGTDASAVRPAKVIGTYISKQHSSSVDARRDVTFTVPDPATLGADPGQDIVTVTVGVCPKFSGFSCASHILKISTGSRSGYKISAPRPTTRAIGQGQNRVAANRPFTLRVAVKNINVDQNAPLPRFVTLSQVGGRGIPARQMSFLRPARGQSNTFQFPMGVFRPGQYTFVACLTDERGYPTTDRCGPEATINVGNQLQASWQVGAVQVNNAGVPSNTAPANQSFRLETTIANISNINNPDTGGTIVVLVRSQGRSGIPGRISGARGPVAAGQTITRFLRSPARAAGAYEFKGCIADTPGAAIPDMICGPWSPITIGADRVLPPPQPVAPVANTCTGGRAKNAQGRCVCPVGSFWNPNPGFKRCYTCTGGRVWSGSQRRCVCPTGTKWNPRANRCGTSFQAVPTPQIRLPALGKKITIRCSGGAVRNGACLCPRGFTRKTIRKNVYVCKPPFKRPVPGASQTRPNPGSSATTLQNQLKKPKAGKMQCIGGQVKGPLCWCGIGRFPKKIGNNVYRCQ